MAELHSILVVDDEPEMVQSVQDLLRYEYRVLGATQADQGLQILERESVEIVMSDQRLPAMTGLDFLQRVREVCPRAIRLLFTAYADTKSITDAIDSGVVHRHIGKPWDPNELRVTLRQAIEQYELLAERDRLQAELQVQRPVGAGKILGPYQLLEKIGEGGMGAVFKAIHTMLNKVVALKILPAERMGDAKAVARFLREMKAVGCLHHPNIVQGSDAGQIDRTHFLVMEFVDGLTLAALVDRRGPLPIAEACELIRCAAMGMQHAHEHGLVHRDLKPSNIMLTRAGEVKILDLGLARLCNEATLTDELTSTGQMVGTIGYMAPEQASGHHAVSVRSDLYSLGCTLFKLLAGRPPFSGPKYATPLKILLAHGAARAPSIRDNRPEAPPELATLLDRLLAKDPADRPATALRLATALTPFAAGADLCQLIAPREAPTTDYSPLSS